MYCRRRRPCLSPLIFPSLICGRVPLTRYDWAPWFLPVLRPNEGRRGEVERFSAGVLQVLSRHGSGELAWRRDVENPGSSDRYFQSCGRGRGGKAVPEG